MNEHQATPTEGEPTQAKVPKVKPLVDVVIQAKLIGRDKKPIVPEDVLKLAALGCTNQDIRKFYGVPVDSLTRHFAGELERGREEMRITLRKAMFRNACENMNAAVQIFLSKNLLGMSDSGLVNDEEDKILPWNDDETE